MNVTKNEIFQKLKDQQNYLSSEYGLKRIGLFGSYARGTQTEESDIDLVAEFEKPIGLKFMDFTEFLEQLLGKKTDVLTPEGIKGIRNPSIAEKIQETVIYV
ncbi:MAG: nucleotidyltransferase family protein [SAR324 cluster bacterium]|nr:nucleotidyltransferase family protein [SAR324 cluster bacterium]